MSYEMFRCDVLTNLSERLPEEQVDNAIEAVDMAATKYDVSLREVSLSVVGEIPEEVKMYLASRVVKGLSKGTLMNYFYALKMFFSYINKPLNQITSNDIRTYISLYKMERGISDRTAEKKRIELNSFFEWLVDEEIIAKNPVRRVDPIKYYVKQRRAMTPEEFENARFVCRNQREKAVLDFLYSTGCRVSELCNMDISDIDFDSRVVRIRKGKGEKDRISFMNAESVVSMKAYLAIRTDSCPALIVNWTKSEKHRLKKKAIEIIINNICERANVKWHVTPHNLRHTMATSAIHNGCPVEHIQKLLGHSKLTTTMEYVKIVNDDIYRSHERYVV